MRTIVHQSFRTVNVPPWIEQCLASARAWAAGKGYDYRLVDDCLADYAGRDYCARVRHNWQAIANLARLELAREALRAGYQRVIWLDADVIVFDPERLAINLTSGYAFCLEVWLEVRPDGAVDEYRRVNNCACVFTADAVDLDMLVGLIRHVVAHRQIRRNLTVGTELLHGLQPVLDFPLLTHVGLFNPWVVRGLASGEARYAAIQARAFAHPIYAANLCASMQGQIAEADYLRAIDVLLSSRGDVVNRHLGADSWLGEPSCSDAVEPTDGEGLLLRREWTNCVGYSRRISLVAASAQDGVRSNYAAEQSSGCIDPPFRP